MHNFLTIGYLGLDLPELIVIGVILGIFFVGMEVARRVLWGFVLKKSGEKMWKAWVPVVDLWTIFKLGNFPGWFGVVAWAAVTATVVLSIIDPDATSSFVWMYIVLAVIVVAFAVVSLISIYRIGRRISMPGPMVLVYIFAGELVWLIVAVVWKSQTLSQPDSNRIS